MRSRRLTWCAAATVVATAAGSAAFARSDARVLRGPIVPAKSVGPLRLGMTPSQMRPLLGRLGQPRIEMHVLRGEPIEYIEYVYPANWAAYTVGYLGPPGRRRAVLITAHHGYNRLRNGLGVGTTERKLRRTYRSLQCRTLWTNQEGTHSRAETECRLGRRTGRHTIFILVEPPVVMGRPPEPTRVSRVVVRDAFVRPQGGSG